MFDDYHPMLVAGICGAVISIFLSKVIGVFCVIYKRQQLVESLKVLDDRSRPVLERMANYGPGISWTQALDDAKAISVSWYNVFNILKLNEKINAPTSDIYSTMKVAELVAAEAAVEAAGERVQGEWEWVSIHRMGQWEFRKVRVSPQRPPRPTLLPPKSPYPTSTLPSCSAPERDMEDVAVLRSEQWEWVRIGVPGSEDWVWQWIAVPRSGKWVWLWCRVPPPPPPPPPSPPASPPVSASAPESTTFSRASASVKKEKKKGDSVKLDRVFEDEEKGKEKVP